MVNIQNDAKKPNFSTDETKGIFEKYEMQKLNKYAVAAIGFRYIMVTG